MSIKTYQPDQSFKDNILRAITTAFSEQIDEYFEKKKKELIEDLDKEKTDFMYRSTLRLGEILRIEDFGRNLVITFEKK